MAKETRTNNPHAQAPRLPLSPGLPTAPGAADQASSPQALQINMINWYYDNKGSLRYEIWVLNSENKNKPDGSILGRYILLQVCKGMICHSSLMALPLHLFVLMLPQWAPDIINRHCCSFVWKRKEEVNSGDSILPWSHVCISTQFGSFGVLNLNLFGTFIKLGGG